MMKKRVQYVLFTTITVLCFLIGAKTDLSAQTITFPGAGDIIKAGPGIHYKMILQNLPPTTSWIATWTSNGGKNWTTVSQFAYGGIGSGPTNDSVNWSPAIFDTVDNNCYVAYLQENASSTFDTIEKDGPFTVWSNHGTQLAFLNPSQSHQVFQQDDTVWLKFNAPKVTQYGPDSVTVFLSYLQPGLPSNFKTNDTLTKGLEASDLRSGGADSVKWIVPRTPTNGLRVNLYTTDGVVRVSDSITIQGAAMAVTSPKGGDTVYVGSTDTIKWTVSAPVSNDTVTIKYSADAGHTFQTIASKVSASKGSYAWHVQGVNPVLNNAEVILYADNGFIAQQSNTFSVVQINGVSEPSNIPSVYLDQNYPNPFSASGDNSVTNIPFSLNSPQSVSLQVFDVLGREVFRSPAQFFNAGTHTVQFNAAQFLPGAYWYDVVAGTRSLTGSQRMMLYVK